MRFGKIATNGLGLCEEGDFKAQMFNKPQMLIEVQIFNLALLPLFRKAPVCALHEQRTPVVSFRKKSKIQIFFSKLNDSASNYFHLIFLQA